MRDLGDIERRGFDQLSAVVSHVSDELSNLTSVMEWGFEELKWELQQQTAVLVSIDHTLKNPSQTQAHEWRRMAEQLRERGCLREAAQWFQKALAQNPLDYRIYVGLAVTYLRGNAFEKARDLLEKSLPHAPKCKRLVVDPASELGRMLRNGGHATQFQLPLRGSGESRGSRVPVSGEDTWSQLKECLGLPGKGKGRNVEQITDLELELFELEMTSDEDWDIGRDIAVSAFDYRSYSYRLMGRVSACNEDFVRATGALQAAIDISPDYAEGNYDYAQYCVQSGDKQWWTAPLREAILARPNYWYMAWAERNFFPVRKDLASLLKTVSREARKNAVDAIAEAEGMLQAADQAISRLPALARGSGTTQETHTKASQKLADARSNAKSSAYPVLLRSAVEASESMKLAQQGRKQAVSERDQLAAESARRLKNAWDNVVGCIGPTFGMAFLGWFLFGVGGCCMRVLNTRGGASSSYPLGAFGSEGRIGLILALAGCAAWAAWEFKRALDGQ